MPQDFITDKSKSIDSGSCGRIAVDIYTAKDQIGLPLKKATVFNKYPGGSSGNYAIGASRLGLKTAMLSCVGEDANGDFLIDELKKENVDISQLKTTPDHLTGLVMLGMERKDFNELIFYRENCADMQLKREHINKDFIAKLKTLAFTGTVLSQEGMRDTANFAADIAKSVGTKVLIDLDYRPVLWKGVVNKKGNGETRYVHSDEVSKHYQAMLPKCDLIVGTEEEISIAGGSDDVETAIKKIRELAPTAPIVVKRGSKGCEVRLPSQPEPIVVPPYHVEVLNTLGAGDGFMSGLMYGLLNDKSWEESLKYANACGAYMVTVHGCAPFMPTVPEIEKFMKDQDPNNEVIKKKVISTFKHAKDEVQHEFSTLKTKLTSGLSQLNDEIRSGLSHLKKTTSSNPVIHHHETFPRFFTPLVKIEKGHEDTDIGLGILKLKAGDTQELNYDDLETGVILKTGNCRFEFDNQERTVERKSLFDEDPYSIHFAAKNKVRITALKDSELCIFQVKNNNQFGTVFYDSTNMAEPSEERGKGILDDTSSRVVRTIVDIRNRPSDPDDKENPKAYLVFGEVRSKQGGWSSWPPHFHKSKEVYQYSTSEPKGFGISQIGMDNVYYVHNGDAIAFPSNMEHAQVSMPGNVMHYIWVVRHLKNHPYIVPTFNPDYEWTRHDSANERVWKPK